MAFSLQQLEEIVLVLENESKFYYQYGGGGRTFRNDTYGKRRAIVGDWLVVDRTRWAIPRVNTWPAWVGKHTVEDRD